MAGQRPEGLAPMSLSTEAKKAIVRRIFEEGFNQGNLSVVDEVVASGSVDHHHPDEADFPTHLKQVMMMMRSAFPDLHFDIEQMVAEGEMVACRLTVYGTHQGPFMGIEPTGRRIAVPQMHMVRVLEDGKGHDHWAVMDDLGMMRQLGAIPAPPVPA